MTEAVTDNPLNPTVSIINGDCESELAKLPVASVDLVFTSPPYYNARPEYATYNTYQEYLEFLQRVVRLCGNVLREGRFLVVNTSPVLVPRESRAHQSKRLAIPFDLHPLITSAGFDFIDDIIWRKPLGAGMSSKRSLNFNRNRVPLTYKSAPITEYVMVYRKQTKRLIDWNVDQYSSDEIEASKVKGDFFEMNVWDIAPARSKLHPAVFPAKLAEAIIGYYSMVGDTVLDPFAGLGTTGKAAKKMDRNSVMIERDVTYCDAMVDWQKE